MATEANEPCISYAQLFSFQVSYARIAENHTFGISETKRGEWKRAILEVNFVLGTLFLQDKKRIFLSQTFEAFKKHVGEETPDDLCISLKFDSDHWELLTQNLAEKRCLEYLLECITLDMSVEEVIRQGKEKGIVGLDINIIKYGTLRCKRISETKLGDRLAVLVPGKLLVFKDLNIVEKHVRYVVSLLGATVRMIPEQLEFQVLAPNSKTLSLVPETSEILASWMEALANSIDVAWLETKSSDLEFLAMKQATNNNAQEVQRDATIQSHYDLASGDTIRNICKREETPPGKVGKTNANEGHEMNNNNGHTGREVQWWSRDGKLNDLYHAEPSSTAFRAADWDGRSPTRGLDTRKVATGRSRAMLCLEDALYEMESLIVKIKTARRASAPPPGRSNFRDDKPPRRDNSAPGPYQGLRESGQERSCRERNGRDLELNKQGESGEDAYISDNNETRGQEKNASRHKEDSPSRQSPFPEDFSSGSGGKGGDSFKSAEEQNRIPLDNFLHETSSESEEEERENVSNQYASPDSCSPATDPNDERHTGKSREDHTTVEESFVPELNFDSSSTHKHDNVSPVSSRRQSQTELANRDMQGHESSELRQVRAQGGSRRNSVASKTPDSFVGGSDASQNEHHVSGAEELSLEDAYGSGGKGEDEQVEDEGEAFTETGTSGNSLEPVVALDATNSKSNPPSRRQSQRDESAPAYQELRRISRQLISSQANASQSSKHASGDWDPSEQDTHTTQSAATGHKAESPQPVLPSDPHNNRSVDAKSLPLRRPSQRNQWAVETDPRAGSMGSRRSSLQPSGNEQAGATAPRRASATASWKEGGMYEAAGPRQDEQGMVGGRGSSSRRRQSQEEAREGAGEDRSPWMQGVVGEEKGGGGSSGSSRSSSLLGSQQMRNHSQEEEEEEEGMRSTSSRGGSRRQSHQ